MTKVLHYMVLSVTGLALLGLATLAGFQALRYAAADNSVPSVVAGAAGKTTQKPSFPFPQGLVDQVNSQSAAGGAAAPAYSGYTRLTDDNEALSVFVPKEWADIDTGPWVYQGKTIGTYIQASTDLNKFTGTHSAPGVFIGASKGLAAQGSNPALLSAQRPGATAGCRYGGQTHFTDAFYLGDYDYFLTCAAGGQNLIQAAARPPNGEYAVFFQVRVMTRADLEAAAEIFNTFQAIDDLDRGDH